MCLLYMIFIFHGDISVFIININVIPSFITENIPAQRNTYLRKRIVVDGYLRENGRHMEYYGG